MLNLTDIHFKLANQGQMELAKKCVGDEGCVAKGSTPFVEHNSHLSQIRTGAALVRFDVPLGGGLGRVQRGGTGQIAGAQTDVQGSSFEVAMKRCHSESLYIPLSVS